MSEAAVATPTPTPAPPPAVVEPPAPAPAPTPGVAPALNGKPAPVPTPTPEPTPAPSPSAWPEGLKEKLAGDDPKELARLNRFASLESYLTRTKGIENQLRSGMLKPVLAEGAAEAEIAEYRKAHGIPTEPTIEGYGLTFPENFKPTDGDKADVNAFLAEMHKGNVPAATVKQVWGAYTALQSKAEQQIYETAQKLTVDHKAEIRAEYGRDFERNLALGNTFIAKQIGEDKAKALTSMPLADGTLLGDHPEFVRLFVGAALAGADDTALVIADGGQGAGSIEEQYQKALALADTNPKEYHSKPHQDKLLRLANARMKKLAPVA